MINILVCDRFHQESFLSLKADPRFEIKRASKPIDKKDLEWANALIIRSTTSIDDRLLSSSKNLKIVISCTSGFNHIDIKKAKEYGVLAAFTPDANLYSASELAFTLILNSIKKFQKAQDLIKSGVWKRDQVMGTELYDKTLGIVGLGRIGSRVAQIANGFGMNVIAFDPFVKPEDIKIDAQLVGYEELLRTSDVISIHVPYTKMTKRMFKKNQFESMQSHAVLVNCSRGNVVSEEEMLLALEAGKFRGAAMDVFEREPLPVDSALIASDKVLCSPHIGGCTEESFYRGSEMARKSLINFFMKDQLPENTLPPSATWYEALN